MQGREFTRITTLSAISRQGGLLGVWSRSVAYEYLSIGALYRLVRNLGWSRTASVNSTEWAIDRAGVR